MKFLIVNQHTGNFGDDLAGVSLIQQILSKFSNTEIDIMYRTPKGSINYFGSNVNDRHDLDIGQKNRIKFLFYVGLRMFSLRFHFYSDAKLFNKELENYDYFIVSPAGANIGIYKDWLYLLRLFLIVKSGNSLVFHGNTIGKSNNIVFNILARYVLRHALVYSREVKSTKFLSTWNINAIQTVDTAFLFNNVKESLKFPLRKSVSIPENYIVIIPTQLSNWHPSFKNWNEKDFFDSYMIPQITKIAKKIDANIVVLPHLHGIYAEQEYLLEIAQKLRGYSNKNVIIPEISHFTEYNNFIKEAKFVVSMRYHGVVMSIFNHTPFISLSYENKMTEVCRYAGFSKMNHQISTLESDKIDLYDEYKLAFSVMKDTNFDELDKRLENYAKGPLNQLSFVENGSVK